MECSKEPDEVNDFFTNVANEIVENLEPASLCPLDIISDSSTTALDSHFREVSYIEVRDTINSLKNKNSRDIYGLNSEIIKYVKEIILIPLTKLINDCIRNNIFPDTLKVIPVYKNGSTENLNNYRPISLIPVVSKMFETLLKTQILNFLKQISYLLQISMVILHINLLRMLSWLL